jgi:glycosyltransferase involved in cell wall biosynthesis/GT2 family glycosyltransferase
LTATPSSSPSVRVGIVTWNAHAFIGACLDALPAALGAHAATAEIVVVDNASSDATVEICRAHDVTTLEFAVNAGYACAINEAFAGTTAPILIALNPDTVAEPGALAALIDRLMADPRIGLVAPRLAHFDGRTQYSAHRFPSVGLAAITGLVPLPLRRGSFGDHFLLEGFADRRHRKVSDVDWVIGAVHAMRRDVVGERPYDERWFMYVEDLELCHRIRSQRRRVVLDGTVVVKHLGNVSGSVAFGSRRETRWLDAMYDWYATERGALRARTWALANTIGLLTKLAVLRIMQRFGDRDPLEAKAQSRRRLARYHFGKFVEGPRPREARARPPGSNAPRRMLGLVAGGLLSGAERVLLRDLVEAQARGWEVRIACHDGPLVAQAELHGIARVAVPDLRLPELPRVLGAPLAAWRGIRTARILRRHVRDSEILVVNSVNALSVVRAIPARTPVVYFAHDVLVRLDRRILLRLAASRIDIAIAVSEWVAKRLRTLRIPTEVVYNGTRCPVDPASPDPDAAPIVGISALLTPWKGHEVLLEAFGRLEHPTAQLEIMGGVPPKDARYAGRLKAMTQRLGLEPRVRFLGHCADPLAIMRRWTLAVSASTDPEAGPLVALEAMSLGVPVIATDHGGVTEVLGDAGELVAPNDPAALARAIDAVLTDPVRRQGHVDQGPKILAARGFTLESQSLHWLSVLDSVARGIPEG